MLLFIIIFVLFVLLLVISFFSHFSTNSIFIRKLALSGSLFCFFLSAGLFIFFDKSNIGYQFLILQFFGIKSSFFYSCYFAFGIDGISLFFIILTTFLIPLCLLLGWKDNFKYSVDYCFYFILLEFFLILSFSTLDIISFFFCFESTLIPMFFIIGIWGSRQRKIRAAFMLFLYTLFGSIFLFFVFLFLYFEVGTTSFSILSKITLNYQHQLFLWLFLFVSFSIKIPSLPFHIWLPEAHVEAPTGGSVMLAALLLKLGGYGFLRILLPFFSNTLFYYLPLVHTVALISILYASLTTIRQVDLKRIIAYSSIAHMNLVVLGIFSCNIQGIAGSVFLMLAHGIVSSALFFSIGFLYDRYRTRLLFYYGGLVQVMPVFSCQFLVLCLANTGLPGTCNFIGELVCFIGLVDSNILTTFISLIGVVLSVLYTIWLFERLAFGNLNRQYLHTFNDLNYKELCILFPLFFFTIFFGFFPNIIFSNILGSVSLLCEKFRY